MAALDPAFAREIDRLRGRSAKKSGEQRARQKLGDAAESHAEDLHALCLARGVAFVRKLPTPWKPIRPGPFKGSMVCVPEKKSGADYIGVMLDGTAREVCAECKRTTDRRLNFGRIEPHQREDLDRSDDAGAVAVLVVIYAHDPRTVTVHAVPWSEARDRIARGEKSLGPEELAPHRVPEGEPYLARWIR